MPQSTSTSTTSPEPTMTTQELAAKYCVKDMNSLAAWYKLLTRWRDKRSLQEGTDYTIERTAGKSPVYRYCEASVVRLLKLSDSMFATSVRIEYRARIAQIVQTSEKQ